MRIFRSSLTIFLFSIILFSQVQDICEKAKIDAEKMINRNMWFAIGFFLDFPYGWPLIPILT